MATAPETNNHAGQGSLLPEQPRTLDTLAQSLGLDQLSFTMLLSTAKGNENAQLRGLSKAINALAQEMANKFRVLGERLNALEANPRQQLTPQVQNDHKLTLVNASTPTCIVFSLKPVIQAAFRAAAVN